ncbi:MAG: hypothetical protein AcusKO_02850 [Acuticoccus sp.]
MNAQLDVDGVRTLLERRIDQSTIAAELKAKIEANREFFEKGTKLIEKWRGGMPVLQAETER